VGSQQAGIAGQVLQSLGTAGEEQVQGDLLVRADEQPQRFRDREGAGTLARIRRTSEAESTTGSLNWGLARASSSSWGQARWRVFSQKSLMAQMAWVLVWRATFLWDFR
jgi:hypothetical protein